MAERCIYADDFLDLFYVASAGQDKMFVKVVEQVVEDTPTADVVEVVRCKDCKHGRKTNRIMSPEKFFKEDCVVCECEDVVGDEPMIYVPTHFCSYGTLKEREKE